MTRGALYHHFTDKTDLFKGVYEVVEAELVDTIWAAALAETRDIPVRRLEDGRRPGWMGTSCRGIACSP